MSRPKTRLNIKGKRFGKLEVLSFVEVRKDNAIWLCRCDCGNFKEIDASRMNFGVIVDCGCGYKSRQKKHGLTGNKFYMTWVSMMHRCYNPKSENYKTYGGRGIKVCAEWHNVVNFINWCEKQPFEKGMSIDRFPDNNGDYAPNNCRFATIKQQQGNIRTNVWVEYNNERLIYQDFVDKYGIVPRGVADGRIASGWDRIEAALTPRKFLRKRGYRGQEC